MWRASAKSTSSCSSAMMAVEKEMMRKTKAMMKRATSMTSCARSQRFTKLGGRKTNMQLPNALKLFGCSDPTRPRYSWLAVAMACILKQVPYSSAQQNNPSTYPINKKKRWNKPKRITHPCGHSSMFTLFYLSAPSQVANQKQLYLFQKHDVQTWLKVITSLYTIEELRLQLSKVNLEWKFLQTHMAKTDTLL